jgi:hypothetical protein
VGEATGEYEARLVTSLVRNGGAEVSGPASGADLQQLAAVLQRISGLIHFVDNARDAALLVRRSNAVEKLLDEALKSCCLLEEQQFDLRQLASEIHLRTQRRAGELIGAVLKHPGGRPSKTHTSARMVSRSRPTLRKLGIGRNESHRWQRIAAVPLDEFERHISECRIGRRELTTSSILRFANQVLAGAGGLGQRMPSSAPAQVVEYDKAKRHSSEMLWLDPLALVVPMDAERRQQELEFLTRLRLWLDEFEEALRRPQQPDADP